MAKRQRHIQPLFGLERAFGEAMRSTREHLKMSQMELQARTGLDRTFISDLERGVQCPSLQTLFRVAEGLDITPWKLVEKTAESRFLKGTFFRIPR